MGSLLLLNLLKARQSPLIPSLQHRNISLLLFKADFQHLIFSLQFRQQLLLLQMILQLFIAVNCLLFQQSQLSFLIFFPSPGDWQIVHLLEQIFKVVSQLQAKVSGICAAFRKLFLQGFKGPNNISNASYHVVYDEVFLLLQAFHAGINCKYASQGCVDRCILLNFQQKILLFFRQISVYLYIFASNKISFMQVDNNIRNFFDDLFVGIPFVNTNFRCNQQMVCLRVVFQLIFIIVVGITVSKAHNKINLKQKQVLYVQSQLSQRIQIILLRKWRGGDTGRMNKNIKVINQLINQVCQGMGNSSSDSSNPFYASDGNKQSQLSQLLQQFKFVSIYEDELFGRCSIIEHKESKELIITKEIICQSDAELQKLFTDFQRRKNTFNHINLLRLRYIIKKKTEGLFSDQHKIILFFDYIVTSLISEFKNRIKTQKYFTNDQINIITCGTLRGYAALEQQNVCNNKVKLTNIYFGLINNMPLPKVIDSNLFPTPTNMQLARKQQNIEDVFLAPEELKNMEQPKYQNSKSGVFSLAISIIQLCLLTPSQDLYNYNKRTINYTQLENRLNIIKNKYPLSIYCLLRDMLQRNDDSRSSFTKLAESLPANLKNLPTTLNISLMKTTGQNNQSSRSITATGFSKVLNPITASQSKRMNGTLVSEYRPEIQVSEIYTNGNRYEGQKKQNLRHGKGKYIYNDGSYYMGDWIKGKMEGLGQLYDPQGNLLYDGGWKDDHYEGAGKLMGVGTDWVKYDGQFRCGKMEGFGEMWFYDGKRYKGQFRNDLPWGRGRMFGRNGEIQNGNWQRGNFISQF